MSKRYANTAFAYAMVAMAAGVFYREFTKILGFTGLTRLSVLHVHYFALGMLFFLLVLALEKLFGPLGQKSARRFYLFYTVGLNLTGVMLFLRGLAQALGTALSKGQDAALSGLAGVGHILLGLGLVFYLLPLRKQAAQASAG